MGEYTIFHTVAWPSTYAYYFFVIGISAALFFISGLSWFREEFKSLRTSSFYLSFVLLVAGGLLLIADLSQPMRFIFTLNPFYWNFASPLTWGSILLLLFGAASVAYFLAMQKNDEALARKLAVAGSLIALGLPIYTGFDLSVHQHRPVWNTPLMPVLFVALSLISGAAVASFLAKGEARLLTSLRQIMLVASGATAVMLLSLLVTTANGGSASELTFMFMTSGLLGAVFIGLGVIVGTVVPLAVLAVPFGKQASGIMLASVLLLVGGMALRYSILMGPQIVHTYF
ncbi:MAG: thiosulfate reductase [Gallionellales bacterium RIFCSPHIGHO2_02_FULL_57_16]|nr:MAG: thiosulfate reductase [Gallionellales bacterium RIFCSPHIGHO2_02_FULL_57_16]